MKAVALALLLLASCESAKLKPWISYSEHSGSNLGINEAENRFINSALGDSWTVGLAFEFPLGPASPTYVKFEWPDLEPRYALHKDGPIVFPGKEPPEASLTDKAQEAIETNWLPYAGAIILLLIVAVVLAKVGLLKGKNGKSGS